jgi:hypothetical protein
MECIFCGKSIMSLHKDPICDDCEEAANLAHAIFNVMEQWKDSIVKDDHYWKRGLGVVSDLVQHINDQPSLNFVERALKLDFEIEKMIMQVASYYHRNDLMIGTILIKEMCRVEILNPTRFDVWFTANEYEVACVLQIIFGRMKEQDFIGHSISDYDSGYLGFITAIVLARILIMLRENLSRYKYKAFTTDLMDLVRSLYEDESLKEYFEQFITMGQEEKPEDIKIENPFLHKYLKQNDLLREQIYESVQVDVEKIFGFTSFDIVKLFKPYINKKTNSEYDLPLQIIKTKKFRNESILSSEKLDSILEVLSLNRLFKWDSNISERHVELRSIFEANDFIVFGTIDLLQNVGIFEKLVFSGHYLDMYSAKEEIPKSINNAQTKMATLLSFKLAETLHHSNYCVPTHKVRLESGIEDVLRAEINKIPNGNRNILQGLGDIDVLALNKVKRQILNIEIKYFKPGINMRDLVFGDANRIAGKKVIEKVLRREKAIKENLDSVVQFICEKENSDGYTVRSFVVTIRPNFYAIDTDLKVEYLTYNELIKSIKLKQI